MSWIWLLFFFHPVMQKIQCLSHKVQRKKNQKNKFKFLYQALIVENIMVLVVVNIFI